MAERPPSAGLSSPFGVAVDSSGNLYIADFGNYVIRKVTAATGIISTVAGNNTPGYSGDGAAATSARLNLPTDVAVDSSGNLYIADAENSIIRKVTAATGNISTIAGTGVTGYTGDGGAATSAKLYFPYGVALDSGGNVYISDSSTTPSAKLQWPQASSVRSPETAHSASAAMAGRQPAPNCHRPKASP